MAPIFIWTISAARARVVKMVKRALLLFTKGFAKQLDWGI
jgi:hypothetical protein